VTSEEQLRDSPAAAEEVSARIGAVDPGHGRQPGRVLPRHRRARDRDPGISQSNASPDCAYRESGGAPASYDCAPPLRKGSAGEESGSCCRGTLRRREACRCDQGGRRRQGSAGSEGGSVDLSSVTASRLFPFLSYGLLSPSPSIRLVTGGIFHHICPYKHACIHVAKRRQSTNVHI
jgi:hypothetical protein